MEAAVIQTELLEKTVKFTEQKGSARTWIQAPPHVDTAGLHLTWTQAPHARGHRFDTHVSRTHAPHARGHTLHTRADTGSTRVRTHAPHARGHRLHTRADTGSKRTPTGSTRTRTQAPHAHTKAPHARGQRLHTHTDFTYGKGLNRVSGGPTRQRKSREEMVGGREEALFAAQIRFVLQIKLIWLKTLSHA